ncbi:MAG: PCP reductase family protein [Leptolyngbyaceae bacterium]|nr:PCP reductase family protein [Leptolyngbyaceae bacterium]
MTNSESSDALTWTPEATEKLKEIPFFVRPFARKKIEQMAQDNGWTTITVEVYDTARQKFN